LLRWLVGHSIGLLAVAVACGAAAAPAVADQATWSYNASSSTATITVAYSGSSQGIGNASVTLPGVSDTGAGPVNDLGGSCNPSYYNFFTGDGPDPSHSVGCADECNGANPSCGGSPGPQVGNLTMTITLSGCYQPPSGTTVNVSPIASSYYDPSDPSQSGYGNEAIPLTVSGSPCAGAAPPAGTPPPTSEQPEQCNPSESPCLCPNINVLPSRLAPATDGQAYGVQLTGSGGQAPYSFSLAGSMPPGMTLSANGLLSASDVRARPGRYPINFNMVDARSCQGSNQGFTQPQGFTLLLLVLPSNAFQSAAQPGPSGALQITSRLPGPGRMSAVASVIGASATARLAARHLVVYGQATQRVRHAGRLRFVLRPSRAGRRLLARTHHLRLDLRLTFTPAGGRPKSKQLRITVP
jgi:hypothetical protein